MKHKSAKRRATRRRRPRLKRGQARPASAHHHRLQEVVSSSFDAPEVWHEPGEQRSSDIRFVRQDPGAGYVHVVETDEVRQRIAELPDRFTREIEVVQFSAMTRKRSIFPCYGMQWGQAVYLYPMEDSLTEVYVQPPRPQQVIETRMYGGRWSEQDGTWLLQWNRRSIRDFYLHNVLIHEIGHLNDDRNRSYRDRERYADWFAVEYGYRPWKGRQSP